MNKYTAGNNLMLFSFGKKVRAFFDRFILLRIFLIIRTQNHSMILECLDFHFDYFPAQPEQNIPE